MAEDNMAEQEPHEVDQQKPEGDFNSQPLRFAPEGAFSGQNTSNPLDTEGSQQDFENSNQYDARIGGGTAGRREHVPGAGPAKERESQQKRKGLKKIMLGGGAAVAAGAVAVGSLIGIDRMRSGNENPDTSPGGSVTQVDNEPVNTPTSASPTETPTPEEPTATPTPEIKEYPREMGSSFTFGNTTFELTKSLQETGVDLFGEKIKVNEVYLNTEDFPEAEEKLNEGIMYGQYLAWQTDQEGRDGITFEEFKQRLEAGEDMTYTIFGYKEDEILEYGKVTVDPSKPVHIALLDVRAPAIGLGINAWGFRVMNGELYIEMYDQKGFGVNDDSQYQRYKSSLAFNLEWAMALLSEREAQERKGLIEDTGYYVNKAYSFAEYFYPNQVQDPASPIPWNSILRVR